ncbi:phosphate starvation-inducible protein PhoH [Caldicoprobacter faecalis]|uniref:PhoH-like protein n=2 Tax=Caldicoprobacter faecalis TaxID=937334 RepID=A0A1I5XXS2_9FIRM|nr:PhoH family protein [Caldicoprobacter faecalis]SFQ36716.1 phosphate starvation-inducible protein PhoH [Caldicoprobacter faecalis]
MESFRVEKTIEIDSMEKLRALFGNFDENVEVIEEEIGVRIVTLGKPQQVEMAYTVMTKLLGIISRGEAIDKAQVRYAIQLVAEGREDLIEDIASDVICLTYKGKQVRCKTLGQKRYVTAIAQNDIVFGIGPAGTGKTYLAMAMAVTAYKSREVGRIILTRPAVEAGEKLGFLPGDLQNKVDPYLRPLYDALYDLIGLENYLKLVERGIIEVAPLAYMRGRTLEDSFIILDEAQNTTSEQMKMFLTRIGIGSKAVITGDITQIDLPRGKKSGLVEAIQVLKGIKGIEFVFLTQQDVVRHELVMKIVQAYEKFYSGKGGSEQEDIREFNSNR